MRTSRTARSQSREPPASLTYFHLELEWRGKHAAVVAISASSMFYFWKYGEISRLAKRKKKIGRNVGE